MICEIIYTRNALCIRKLSLSGVLGVDVFIDIYLPPPPPRVITLAEKAENYPSCSHSPLLCRIEAPHAHTHTHITAESTICVPSAV